MALPLRAINPAVIVLGAGGHARSLVPAIRAAGYDVQEFTSKDEDVIARHPPGSISLVNGIGSAGMNSRARHDAFERFAQQGFRFLTLVHPDAIVDESAHLGEGCQIQMGAMIQTAVRIGRNCIVNTGSVIDHDCTIGDHTHVSPGAVICGGVQVGAMCFIGAGTVIRQGIRIGSGSVIGAGSLVLEDVPERTLCYGHPTRIIRTL
jgi:sugar O-acyltransferase (sialic acid O-acetyltransferase NeuD family)